MSLSKFSRAVAAAVVVGVSLVSTCGTAKASPPSHTTPVVGDEGYNTPYRPRLHPDQSYRAMAIEALNHAMAAQSQAGSTTYSRANIARARFALYGWNDRVGRNYLNQVLAAQHNDGGWGFDKTGKRDTWRGGHGLTYTVTTTDHVGPLLLDGYQAGVVPRDNVRRAVRSVLTTATSHGGQCFSYYWDVKDVKPNTKCVNNVNASAGWFLVRAWDLGIREKSDQLARGERALAYDRSQYNYGWEGWRYSDVTRGLQDLDHNALNAVAQRSTVSGRSLGSRAIKHDMAMAWSDPDNVNRMAVLRLTPFLPSKCVATRAQARRVLDYYEDQFSGPQPRTPINDNSKVPLATIRFSQTAQYAANLSNVCGR